MRLHHLSIAAFGPFAGTEEIDFDELCDAGLFLLTGPTGAGKTTVLDAVCFALYGSVPGARGVKALKSQHAPEDRRPEVVLEFSVRERRFVVRRTPEWSRPKRRGDGFTTENASATIVERTSGEDHLLSSRAQEVGHFIGELIGMQATQFVQVAMLPQGDFQKFLRASSQDRHDVLQHLFRTDRYARIEDWVHDHSRDLQKRSAEAQQAVVRVLDTVADRVGAELPEHLAGDALRAPEARAQAADWVAGLLTSAETALVATRDQHTAAEAGRDLARAAHEEAAAVHALHARRDQARRSLEELADGTAAEEAARDALDADSRSSRCTPVVRMLDEAVTRREAVARDWERSERTLRRPATADAAVPDPVSADDLAALEQQARDRTTRLQALLPREQQLVDARDAVADAEQELATVTTELTAAQARAAEIPAALEESRSHAAAAAAVAGRSEALRLELEHARRCLEAAESAQRCSDSLPALEDSARDARDRAADARELVQDLTARRLSGIAAELAGRLSDGEPCQVCGSTDHPEPASPSAEAVTEAEQTAAAAEHDAAVAAHTAAEGRVLQARERLDGLLAVSGGRSPQDVAAEVERLVGSLAEAEQARADLDAAEQRVRRLTEELAELDRAVSGLEVRSARLTQALEGHRATVRAIAAELAEAVGDGAGVREALDEQDALVELFAEAREARCALDDASSRVAELAASAEAAATEHGFDGVSAVRAAMLDDRERARLTDLLEQRAKAEARARAVLDDDEIRALAEQPDPDVAALGLAAEESERTLTGCARALHTQEESVTALRRMRDRLREALDAWAPVLAEYLRADAMARLVRGMGGDNQLQMRLSAYVLARRLDQVVDAANERLAHMRDQRYLLQRTGRATRKGAQAGLGLEVVDQWTGDVRDPATLSGGETFVVSLSLALGLADVVTQEAGGTEIETLFVDEGFGTLDADTLDDVMDRLDELRAGGRAVGVVSHVSELRNRIPTQLHVDKRRNGSVVAVRTAVG